MLGVLEKIDSAMLTKEKLTLFQGQKTILHASVRNFKEVEEALYFKGPLSVKVNQPDIVIFKYQAKGVKN